MTYFAGSCDVAVIGAGHAGIEAALAAARNRITRNVTPQLALEAMLFEIREALCPR